MDLSDRNALILELRRNGATLQQIADRFRISPQRAGQILEPEPVERLRGRPCPNVIDGHRCFGSSRVTRVWHDDKLDIGIRYRECLTCGYQWYTKEEFY